MSSDQRRARDAVRSRVDKAIKTLRPKMPMLAAHLEKSIQGGVDFKYDPGQVVLWTVMGYDVMG